MYLSSKVEKKSDTILHNIHPGSFDPYIVQCLEYTKGYFRFSVQKKFELIKFQNKFPEREDLMDFTVWWPGAVDTRIWLFNCTSNYTVLDTS